MYSHICTWLLNKPWLWLYRPLWAKGCLCFLILSRFVMASLNINLFWSVVVIEWRTFKMLKADPVYVLEREAWAFCVPLTTGDQIGGHQRWGGFQFSSVQFSCSVVSNTLRSHESQHARPPGPTPRVHSKVLFFKPNLVIKDSNLTVLFYSSKYASHGRMKVKFIHLFNLD